MIVLGVAAASSIEAKLVYDPQYHEDGLCGPHYWVEIGGQRLDCWQREVRLRPRLPGRQ